MNAPEGRKERVMIPYKSCGEYFIPDLKLSETRPIGKYGRMRKRFLKEHRPILYSKMVLSESLFPHLAEIDETAERRLDSLIPALAREAGATEALKAADPLRWVGLMNACHAQAEEIVLEELIYA
jgi:hypothetical protein